MDSTLTIRLSKEDREALRRRARAEGCSESAFLRRLIERETERGFDFESVRHLAGSLDSGSGRPKRLSWKEHLRKRNWRS